MTSPLINGYPTRRPTNEFPGYARDRVNAARRATREHVTSAYTGLCLGCGRPGPCEELRLALSQLARYTPAAANRPDLVTAALVAVGDSLTELRASCAEIVTATDVAGYQLHGTDRPHRRLPTFYRAIVDARQALGEVYAGLHESRTLPAAPATNAGQLLTGLRTGRDSADRAAALAATIRLRLTVAADRLRRTGTPAALVAARRFGAAIRRLDLVTARLAIGGINLDRYAAALGHVAAPARRALPAPPPPSPGSTGDISAGAYIAYRLVCAAWRRHRRTLWTRIRHQLRTEVAAR